MRLKNQIWLAILAIVLTALLSAVVFTVGYAIVAYLDSTRHLDIFGTLAFVGTVSVFGTIAALLPSILMAVVEWPQSRRLASKLDGGFVHHVLVSILWSQVIFAIGIALTVVFQGYEATFHPELGDSPFFVAPVFALGGLCSSIVWHFLFVRTVRKRAKLVS